ncbi:MAG: dihydrofolate reductase family protein [Terriglobales bacterium]|jgi:dihydrofolate reductase
MSKLRVHSFGMSLDGYGAGPSQSLENPLGIGGLALHEWAFKTRIFHSLHGTMGKDGGETGVDDDFVARGFDDLGAWIIGRNMFGPVRGPWTDDTWRGWWGDDPPYHTPVFVLTNHARPSLTMSGGTTFHFVTTGIANALALAREAAEGKDVRLGGGVATIREYLRARLVDEMHLAYAAVLLGAGECLLAGMNLPALGYQVHAHVTTANVMHVTITKKDL